MLGPNVATDAGPVGGVSRVSRTSKTKNLHPVKNREHLRVRTLDSLQAIYGPGVVPTHPFIDGMVELTILREAGMKDLTFERDFVQNRPHFLLM